ncbi:putative Iron transport multicopper oxidase fio1 [Glarea lozoyensis 74030]|uniref:Putative Iron transport multicopper oxidase fio1 n=1 Tax=Glarea lozoyensis (strain ATCC 74030 / MF5533) TaxID=1104152 RepID=H0EMX4_GLAL7|nr:putative Iron transport multicopper oxidase fio1 [Glarea lozoyensis 74030]
MADTYYLQDQKDVDDDYKNGKCGKGLEPPPTGIVHKDYMGTDGINTIYAGGPSGRLRIRFINMSAFSTMLIFLNNGETKDGTAQGIPFRVSEVDSVPLDRDYMPIAKAIELNAGQRMSIIVDLDNDLGNDKAGFNVITTMNPASGATPPPAPVMTFSRPPRYPASPSAYDNTRIWVNSQWKLDNIPIWADKNASPNTVVTETWYLNKFIPAKKVPRIAFNGEGSMPTKFLSVDFTATTGPGGSKEFATLNEKTFVAPGSPVLLQAMRPLPPSCPNSPLLLGIGMPKPVNTNTLGPEPYYANNPGQGNVVENTITVEQGQTIYMLLKAHVGSHTFHLHGHDFQVLYTQPENESSHELAVPDIELLKNNGLSQPASPMRRDTLFVTTKTVALIAFTADNPVA